MIKPKEVILGIKVPAQLKDRIFDYCDRNGVKIKYFVAQAIRGKLLEIAEDNYDNAIVDGRLENPAFTAEKNMKRYLQKRKTGK
ncbi:MAG: hypothetical protein HY210_00265 [Candidatus Omnitrophica bacterium]|nr:hypothetical protein [Candidatus Omnitrophota bacterium]